MVVKASGLGPGFEAWSPLRNSVLIRSSFNSSLLTEADAAEGSKIGRLVVPEPSMPGPSPLLMNLETVPALESRTYSGLLSFVPTLMGRGIGFAASDSNDFASDFHSKPVKRLTRVYSGK